jgi:hypothetical protein
VQNPAGKHEFEGETASLAKINLSKEVIGFGASGRYGPG